MAQLSPALQSPLQSRGSKEFKAALEAALQTPDSSREASPEKRSPEKGVSGLTTAGVCAKQRICQLGRQFGLLHWSDCRFKACQAAQRFSES